MVGVTDAPGPLLDSVEFARWTASADRALGAATDLANLGHHEFACFQAEQAAQLGVKALLRGVGSPSFGHDLALLGRDVAAALEAPLSDDIERALSRLSRHYIPTRYPDAWAGGTPGDHYAGEDSAQALADAGTVLAAVRSAFETLTAASGAAGDHDDAG